MVAIKRLPVHPHSTPSASVALSKGWLLSATLDVVGLPDVDDEDRVLISPEFREPCENAVGASADLIFVLNGCSLSVIALAVRGAGI
jgi:hypothetical protein